MDATTRVLLADAHPLWHLLIRSLLADEDDLVVVGRATDADQVERLSRELHPQLVLLDLNLPGPPTTELVPRLRQHSSGLRVLVLAESEREISIHSVLLAGAGGCVIRDEVTEQTLLAGMRAVARGEGWLSPRALATLGACHRVGATAVPADGARLTKRQIEVIRLVGRGWTNERVGRTLGIGERAVRFHLTNLRDRLCLTTRAELIAWALREGLD